MVNVFFSGSGEGSARTFSQELGIKGEYYTNAPLFLHAGNIKDPFVYKTRKYLYELDDCASWQSIEIKRFKKNTTASKDICLWYSTKDTDEYLGMLATLDYFSDKDKNIWLCNYSDICTAMPYIDLVKEPFTPPERHIITAEEHERYAVEWHKLQETNAPLRILKDGKITDFPENYIDEHIFEIAGNKEIRIGVICGEILANFLPRMLVFTEYRIHQLIEMGEFVIIKQGMTDAVIGGPAKYFSYSVIKRTERSAQ